MGRASTQRVGSVGNSNDAARDKMVERFAHRRHQWKQVDDIVAVCAQRNDGECEARHMLLIFEISIDGEKHRELLFGRAPQKRPVLDAGPAKPWTVWTSWSGRARIRRAGRHSSSKMRTAGLRTQAAAVRKSASLASSSAATA